MIVFNRPNNDGTLIAWMTAIVLINISATVFAQGVTETVVRRGLSSPEPDYEYFNFGSPSITESGEIIFGSNLLNTNDSTFESGIFFAGDGSPTTIAFAGQQAPDGNGSFYTVYLPLDYSTTGLAPFRATLTGTSGMSTDDTGIFLGSQNGVAQIAREGQSPIDATGTYSSFGNAAYTNNSGQVAFSASLTGTSNGSDDDTGLFIGSGGSTSSLVREGQAAPDGNGEFNFFQELDLNEAGQLSFHSGLRNTNGGFDDDRGIFLADLGSVVQIVREGQAAPDGNGAFSTLYRHELTNLGSVGFSAALTNTANGFFDDTGLFVGDGNSITQIAREGQVATSDGATFANFSSDSLDMTDSGKGAFRVGLQNVDNSIDYGLFRWNGSYNSLIVRTGDNGPDGATTIAGFNNPVMNDRGVLLFSAILDGTPGGTTDDFGLFVSDGIDLINVAQEGDSAFGSTVSSISYTNSGTAINENGQVTYLAFLNNNETMIRKWTPDLHWRRTNGSIWSAGSNWTLGINPAEVHHVAIDPDASLEVNLNVDATTKSLFLGSNTSNGIATLNLQNGNSLNNVNGMNIFQNGVLTGDGTIEGFVFNRGLIKADNLTFVDNTQGGGLVNFEGVIEGNGRVHADITNYAAGSIRANDGDVLQLTGPGLTNQGVIEVRNGEIVVAAHVENMNNTLGTGLITGRDAVMRFNNGVTNQGAIALTNGINDIFGDINNTGSISIAGDAEAIFYDDIVQNGEFVVSSFGSRTSSAVVLGEFSGAGGFTGGGDLFLLGDLRPGNSPDSVLLDGNVFLGASTLSEFEFAGMLPGDFDHMRVTGDLNLGGQLLVSLLDGFQFRYNQEFIVGEVDGQLLGQFVGLAEGSLIGTYGGKELFISYMAGDGNDIGFYTAIPEPGSFAALAVCLVAMTGYRNRNRRITSVVPV